MIDIYLRRMAHSVDLPIPEAASVGAAGLDLTAATPPGEDLILAPGGRAYVPTGFAIELPPGYEGQIRPRSGLALRHGVTVLNSPGTIDADYRGEIGVILVNFGSQPYAVRRGARIAQLVVCAVESVRVVVAETLSPSVRGENGFGSTGISGVGN
jgi:dUTP pyrophosphatase